MPEGIRNITVLMAVYNDSGYLKTSVNSVLNQTHRDFEFLIIDDGSTDNSEEIIRGFKDSRIVYKRIVHCGLAGALNYGLKISSGNWIARIDADDLNTANRLETQIGFLNVNPSIDVVSSWSVYFNDQNKILFTLETPVSEQKIKDFLNLHNPINHSSVIFNKDKILRGGSYDEKFRCYEDFELWFRLRDKLNFRIIPEYLVYTRFRNDSMTMRASRSKKKIYEVLSSNAKLNLKNSILSEETKYWNNILFWIEYFYGDKNKSRKYFSENISIRKSLAYLNTFLPENGFDKIIGLRIKQRISSRFRIKRQFKDELSALLK